jgi:anti-sigma-K factor RskA
MTESYEISVHTLSGAYVVDALDDDERALFEEHLPDCADCQQEVASLREGAAVMADAVALPPPPELRDQVLAGIRTIRPLPPKPVEQTEHVAEVVPLRARFRPARLVAAAAAVLAIAGGGVVWQQVAQDSSSSSTLSAADRILGAADVKHVSLSFDDGATATVFRSSREKGAVLVTRGMAAPPSGKAFELWLRDARGTMRPAGLMTKPGDQKVVLKGDVADATAVGITVEPEGGSDRPTSEPIAMFDLQKADA